MIQKFAASDDLNISQVEVISDVVCQTYLSMRMCFMLIIFI